MTKGSNEEEERIGHGWVFWNRVWRRCFGEWLVKAIVAYQGTNHLLCMWSPLTGGTILSALAAQHPGSVWSAAFFLHKFLDALGHLCHCLRWIPKLEVTKSGPKLCGWSILVVAHMVSFVSHTCRYYFQPINWLENLQLFGRIKIQFYMDCIAQTVSMMLVLDEGGSRTSFVAMAAQWLFREYLFQVPGFDLTKALHQSPHKWNSNYLTGKR